MFYFVISVELVLGDVSVVRMLMVVVFLVLFGLRRVKILFLVIVKLRLLMIVLWVNVLFRLCILMVVFIVEFFCVW